MTYTPTPSPENPFHPSKEWVWKGLPPPEAIFLSGQINQRPKLKKHDKYTFDNQSTYRGPSLMDPTLPPPISRPRRAAIHVKDPLPPGKTLGYLGQPFEPESGPYGFGIYKPSDEFEGDIDFFPMDEEAWHRAVEQASQFSRKKRSQAIRRGSLDPTAPPELFSRPILSRGVSSEGRSERRCQKPSFVPFRYPAAKVATPDPLHPAWKQEFEDIKAMNLKSLSKQEKMELWTNQIFHMLQYLVELPGTLPQTRKYHKELMEIASSLGMEE